VNETEGNSAALKTRRGIDQGKTKSGSFRRGSRGGKIEKKEPFVISSEKERGTLKDPSGRKFRRKSSEES